MPSSVRLIKKSGSLEDIKRRDKAKLANALKTAAFLCEAIAKQLVPVDTGALRASIFVRQENALRYAVGSGLGYAKYVDQGTRFMSAQPWLTPAASLARRRLRELLTHGG